MHVFLENFAEIIGLVIGKVQRDVDDRNIGVDEHVLGDFDFLIGQVGHEVHARFLLEDLGKIIGAHVGVFADLLEGNVVLGVAVDESLLFFVQNVFL